MSDAIKNALMANAVASCRLLTLPAELRTSIYELALVRSGIIETENPEAERQSKQPGLLRTCRLIRLETLPIFYSQNVFRMSACRPKHWKVRDWCPWLTAINKHTVSLRTLVVDVRGIDGNFWSYFIERDSPNVATTHFKITLFERGGHDERMIRARRYTWVGAVKKQRALEVYFKARKERILDSKSLKFAFGQ